ncbi:MAG: putative RNase H-like nuclease (RuvC/YqgF family) [Maribacter sp.]|jgi:predicted RNase H-like nuclease (RuvC/YqgF family)
MGQDLREMFNRERKEARFALQKGHDKRFSNKLDKAMPRAKKRFGLLKIAASVLVLCGLGITAYLHVAAEDSISTTVVNKQQENSPFSLGDLSPDLKKVENYYVANINLQFSKLEVSEDNKAVVDSFMDRLSELNEEYESLTVELNQMGPNDQTISALIENLQLRLQLLQKLKKKLNQLKLSKNEQTYNTSI